MLRVNCLINNQQIQTNLKQVVEYVAYSIAGKGQKASIEGVYNVLRRSNLEVDIQTVSHIYENAFDLNDDAFSSIEEVEAARGATFKRIIDKKAEIIKKNEIGKDSPSVAVAAQLAGLIQTDMKANPTMQKLMQERLLKSARKILGLKGVKPKAQTLEGIIGEVLAIENKNKFGVLGNMENAETLFNDLKSEFAALAEQAGTPYQRQNIKDYADQLTDAAYSFLMSTSEMSKVINDTLKEAGYSKEVNTKNGKRQVVDWNKVTSSDIDFRETIRKVFTDKGFTPKEVSRITGQLEGEFKNLQKAKAAKALETSNKRALPKGKKIGGNAMDKLLNLYQLGIFNSATQDALFKVLGVSSASTQQVKALQSLMKQYNLALKTPMASFSSTYVKTMQREIENIIESIEENDGKLKALRKWGFFSQFSGAAILANLQNITENTLSGFVEWFATIVQSPKQAWQSARIFGLVFTDTLGGGIREGNELSNAFNTSGNLDDRFNFETAKTPLGKVSAALAFIPRALLTSFDNSYKAAITHLLTVNTMRSVLKKQGLSKDESALVVNEMYYGNRKEIEKLAKELEDNLRAAGVKNTGGKSKRIAAELSLANMLSGGKFFTETLEKLKENKKIEANKNAKLNEPFIKTLRNAAESTASKGLGHEADSKAFKLLDQVNKFLQENISEARKNKDKGALINAEIARNSYGMVNRFRSGSLRWMWLSFQKASGIALIQTLVTDVAMNKGKYLSLDNLRLDSENEMDVQNDLSRYLALRQRLVRQTVVPLISYAVGYGVILPAMLKVLGEGDEDDDEKDKARKYARLAKWINEDPARKRWFQKGLPIVVYNYLDKQTRDNYGEVLVRKNPETPSLLDVVDPEFAGNAVINNLNQSTIWKAVEDTRKEMNKEDNKNNSGAVLGKFVANFFNLGGVLKSVELNSDAIKAMSGESTKLTKSQYDKLKPQDFWEGFLYNSLNKGFYKAATD